MTATSDRLVGPVAASPTTTSSLPVMEFEGLVFRDLDHDRVLAPYEDWRLAPEVRAADLVARMSLAEKAGTMLHGTAPAEGPWGQIGVGDRYDLTLIAERVQGRGITSLISRLAPPPVAFAEQNNAIQRVAAAGRLGIPLTMSSDPRHHIAETIGASVRSTGFSTWPETLGLAAIGDPDTVRRFADTVRREYRAVGLQMFLGPQADLSTSPRWPRTEGTFGEDPGLTRLLVGAYVEGLQGGRDGLGPGSVAAVVKHWVGYGASRDGFDGHNWYGRYSAFPSDALDDHVAAFLDAFDARVAAVMPTYNILDQVSLDGVPIEPVGAGFSAELINGLLRTQFGFDGPVISDWGITKDLTEAARTGNPEQTPDLIAMPWGVEHLSRVERFARCINAGVDQIGGEDDPGPMIAAVEAGLITLERIDTACLRILTDKFRLGLFDAPLVEVDTVEHLVATPAALEAAATAERAALTWITGATNRPLQNPSAVVHLVGLDPAAATALGLTVTDDPTSAEVAVVRVATPHQLLHPGHFFGRRQHEGDLDFEPDDPDVRALLELCRTVPTVVVVHLDRPAVLGPVADGAAAVLGEFGASDAAILDVLTGRAQARGRLPFRLHATMADALAQPCDRPSDRWPGRFPVGHHVAFR